MKPSASHDSQLHLLVLKGITRVCGTSDGLWELGTSGSDGRAVVTVQDVLSQEIPANIKAIAGNWTLIRSKKRCPCYTSSAFKIHDCFKKLLMCF